jgi:hypothetical protein
MPLTFRKYSSKATATLVTFGGVLVLAVALAPGASAAGRPAHRHAAVVRADKSIDRPGVRDNSVDRPGTQDNSVDSASGNDRSVDRPGTQDNSLDRSGARDNSSDIPSASDNMPDPADG